MTTRVKRLRHSTTLLADAFTGLEGELSVDLENDEIRAHDGVLAGGFPHLKEDLSNIRNFVTARQTLQLNTNWDLKSVSDLTVNGFPVRTGASTAVSRSVVGTANEVTVTNGDGVADNPTISLPATIVATAKIITDGTFNGAILGTGVTIPGDVTLGGTLDLSGGVVTFANDQISGDAIDGGNISGLVTFSNDVTFAQNVVVQGTLTSPGGVSGNITGTTETFFLLNSDQVVAPTEDVGITVERGTLSNSRIFWNETTDKWQIDAAGVISNLPTLNAFNVWTASQTIKSTVADASRGPSLQLLRDSVSPAASDQLGTVQYRGRNSIGSEIIYGEIYSSLLNPVNGAEAGELRFLTAVTGVTDIKFKIAEGFYANGAVGGDTGVNTINAVGYYVNGVNIFDRANIWTETQTITSGDPGSTFGPFMDYYRDSPTPAAFDFIGGIQLSGNDDLAVKATYARVLGIILDPTSTSKDGRLVFQTQVNNTLSTKLNIADGVWTEGATGGDQGADIINAKGFSIDGVPLATAGPAGLDFINKRVTYWSASGANMNNVIGDEFTITGTLGSSLPSDDQYPATKFSTTAVVGNTCGFEGELLYGLNHNYRIVVRMDSKNDLNFRWWFALTTNTLATQMASDTPAGSYVGFRFNRVTDGVTVQSITRDGTTVVEEDTGVNAATGGHDIWEIIKSGTDITFRHNEVDLITRTVNLPQFSNARLVGGIIALTGVTVAQEYDMHLLALEDTLP